MCKNTVGKVVEKVSDGRSDIQKLNDQVDVIVTSELKKNIQCNNNTELSVDVFAVSTDKRTVYKDRHVWIPVVLMILCTMANLVIGLNGGLIYVLITSVTMYFWYDFLSGILHIILDNPDFINLPLINDSCLEFQWHHRIPTDIISKSFLQVCGDLNVVLLLVAFFCLLPKSVFCCEYRSAFSVLMVANKILASYFGQYCHRMSHTPAHSRPQWVKVLQDCGVMISSREHLKHHHNYDCNFCIGSGMCNVLLRFVLERVTSNKYLLLVFFLGALFLDIPVFLAAYKMINIQ